MIMNEKLQCTNCCEWIDKHLIEIEDYENNPICMCNDCFEANEEYNRQWDIMFAKIQKTVADIKSKSSAE